MSVASVPTSRSAILWTIFVPFVMVTGKIHRNILPSLEWLEVTISFGLLAGACGGRWWCGVTLLLCNDVWWRLLQLANLYLCFDCQFLCYKTFTSSCNKICLLQQILVFAFIELKSCSWYFQTFWWLNKFSFHHRWHEVWLLVINWYIRVAIRAVERLKTKSLRKLGNIWKISKLHSIIP